jgi:hypothetical protein
VVELGIVIVSGFQRPFDETKSLMDAVKGISFIQYINLALILMIISVKPPTIITEYFGPILNFEDVNEYPKFTSKWYLDSGEKIVLAMILEIFMPHMLPMLLMAYYHARRCYDRRGCDRSKSRKF